MSAVEKPKFSIWLGENWPGPYVVSYLDARDRVKSVIVVNGVRNQAEALTVAEAGYPCSDEIKGWQVVVAHVAEASHHMGVLSEYRKPDAPDPIPEQPSASRFRPPSEGTP